MFKDQEFKGLWWIPENPEHRVPGQLVVVPFKESHIELQGDLSQDKIWGNVFNPPLILGISSNGKHITLDRCLLTDRTHNFSGFTTSRFFVQKVYIGVHFKSLEEIHFNGIIVRFVNLDDWANYRSFHVEEQGSIPSRITIHYEQPTTITVNTELYDVTFGAGWSLRDGRSEVNLTEKACISIISKESERSFNDFATIVHQFQNFLSLAIGKPTFPIEIIGQTESSKQELELGKEVYNDIEIFYSALGWNSDPEKAHWFEMLFTLPDVREQLSSLLPNWLEKANSLAPVFDLYFSTLYNPQLYTGSTFLTMTQAIETYHRRRFGGKYQTDDEFESNLYQRFVEVIPPELDQGFKQSLLKGKLKYANEYSLRKRIQELVDDLVENGFPLGFIVPQESARMFVEKICDTRNYLTHYDQALQAEVVNASELFVITMRLRGILEIFLLEELGFDSKFIWKMISNNRGFKYRLGMDVH